MGKEFLESDWKKFRKQIAIWQENYMEKLCKQYIELLQSDQKASEKFWALEKRIFKDKKHPGVIWEVSRSNVMPVVLRLLRDHVIEMDDLEEYSDLFKETIHAYLGDRMW